MSRHGYDLIFHLGNILHIFLFQTLFSTTPNNVLFFFVFRISQVLRILSFDLSCNPWVQFVETFFFSLHASSLYFQCPHTACSALLSDFLEPSGKSSKSATLSISPEFWRETALRHFYACEFLPIRPGRFWLIGLFVLWSLSLCLALLGLLMKAFATCCSPETERLFVSSYT